MTLDRGNEDNGRLATSLSIAASVSPTAPRAGLGAICNELQHKIFKGFGISLKDGGGDQWLVVFNAGMPLTLEPKKAGLTRRIHRYLLVLERSRRRPTQREACCIVLAVQCLREGRVADGIEAMNVAEHIDAIPLTVSDEPGRHDVMTAADLRATFRSAIRNGE